jgi:hypothetical protein
VAKLLLVFAAIVDFGLAALLIGVSGFLFGSGPESIHGSMGFAAAYIAGVIACVLAPVAGFIFNAAGKPGAAQLVAWLPAAAGLVALVIPAPY